MKPILVTIQDYIDAIGGELHEYTAEEMEHTLEVISNFEDLKENVKAMLKHEIEKGYESEKFELIEKSKIEFVDPVWAEAVLYEDLEDEIYTKKLKPVKKLMQMGLEFIPETKETITTFIRKIPTSERALAKREEYERNKR